MDSQNATTQLHERKFAPTYIERRVVELLSIPLADVVTDTEVAARDAGISDASFVRLRRAIDRVACAQSVLEAMGVRSAGASSVTASRGETRVRQMATRDAVDLLAREWPADYPAGAVEWLIAASSGGAMSVASKAGR
ncbi:hypothetical protein ACOCG7_00980 [Paraburkholderia sp. DD10]|uniref:hypothetical protein n=1 Tax=Paraburkholderia sp. DD10 TaxID=3409691 RepID=UPI003B9E3983